MGFMCGGWNTGRWDGEAGFAPRSASEKRKLAHRRGRGSASGPRMNRRAFIGAALAAPVAIQATLGAGPSITGSTLIFRFRVGANGKWYLISKSEELRYSNGIKRTAELSLVPVMQADSLAKRPVRLKTDAFFDERDKFPGDEPVMLAQRRKSSFATFTRAELAEAALLP